MQNSQDQQRLMAEGLTCAEAANALDAAEAEGRRVGSAAEERQRALDRAAKERSTRAISGLGALAIENGIKNILVIDGTGMTADFMSEHLLMIERERSPGFMVMPDPPEQKRAVEASWRGMRYERIGLECGERPDRLEFCRQCILSGRFHAIVFSDLSENERAVPAVERELGPVVQRFMQGGGAVAVTTADAAMVLPMLERLVGVSWQMGGYYRTTWSPDRQNATGVAAAFPGSLATGSFSAKAHAVRAVPEHERIFATTRESRTQSLVPFMAGRDVGQREDADSVASGATQDYDVVIARRAYGAGSLMLFCDINMEPETVQRVLGYVKQCSPDAPIDSVARLDSAAYTEASTLKATGNAAFRAQDFAAAAAAYERALAVYGERGGAAGEQRDEKVKLSSNLAECRLKLGEWLAAAMAASESLALDPTHPKSLVRRAKAAEELGENEAAARDLQCVVGGAADAAQKQAAQRLLQQVVAKRREAEKEAKRREAMKNSAFRAGFAGALGGGGGGDGGGGGSGGGSGGGGGGGQPMPNASMFDSGGLEGAGWARGLSGTKQREWLIDCYRMRVDDDYCWGGGFLHGLYAKEDGDLISTDFLVFCRLAHANRVVPAGWDWAAFVRGARELLPYAFEKADAKEKWGGENVFAAAMGGRSLRATGEVVYGSSCMGMEPSPEHEAMLSECDSWWAKVETACRDVGGAAVWKELAIALGEASDLSRAADLSREAQDDSGSAGDGMVDVGDPNSDPAPAVQSTDAPTLKPQDRVLVHGLVARPELNNELATILTPLDPASGRYGVRVRRLGDEPLQPMLEDVKLKVQNLRPMPLKVVAKADVRNGFHPIHDAAIEGLAAQVDQILSTGVDPDLLDEDGWTPLMRASLWAQCEVVQLLLAHGATPDVPARKTGSTALHFACMHGPRRLPPHGFYDAFRHKLTVESLLAYGAQPGLGNAKGETAITWARQAGETQILEMLG